MRESIQSGPISRMSGEERWEQVVRAQTIAGIFTDTYVGDRPERRFSGAGSFGLATAFDPDQDTVRHCAALLCFLDWDDAKWLFCAGISMDVVQLVAGAQGAFEAKYGPHPGSNECLTAIGDDGVDSLIHDWESARHRFMTEYLSSADAHM